MPNSDDQPNTPSGRQPGENSGSPIPHWRRKKRPRGGSTVPIDLAKWDGWDEDEVDPWALLLQVAGNVMHRYEMWCGLHGFEMPSHLRRAPSGKVGWGGHTKAEPRHDWLWVKIARRCLRRRTNPNQYMDLVTRDFSESRYPPPTDYYLDQIDLRCRGMPEQFLASASRTLQSNIRRLSCERTYVTFFPGHETVSDVDELGMALNSYYFSDHPLFVFCLAREYRLDQLAKRHAPLALIQYSYARDAYNEVYDDFIIPRSLRWAGNALYNYVDAQGD
jgi:hypothetical protein